MQEVNLNLENLKAEISRFFDFAYEKIQNEEFDYHLALILGISILLKYKNDSETVNVVNSIIHDYEHKITQSDDASNMLLNVINEFRYDFFPDGHWSKFPNIWKENISGIDHYILKINTNLKQPFSVYLHEFEMTLK